MNKRYNIKIEHEPVYLDEYKEDIIVINCLNNKVFKYNLYTHKRTELDVCNEELR